MTFVEIFSKTREKIEKIGNKNGKNKIEKVIIDHRERNSLVISELVSLGLETEIKELKIGDYVVKDVAIERKTVSDFLSSMINKRLAKQLEEMQKYKKRILIIEGIDEQDLYSENSNIGINPNAIRGFILSIILNYNTPIIFSKNYKDTAKYIHLLAKKQKKETSLRENRKSLSKKEQTQFILEGFPGIGPKTAKKLLEKFGSLKNIFNASNEDLEKIIGKKSESFRSLLE